MRRGPRRDLVAGVTVAIIALPLALAFGVTSGMVARAGLVTVLLAFVLLAAPLAAAIPLAALAGVLLATMIRMVELGTIRALVGSTRSDAAVLALTFVVTVALDLVTAVAVGLGLAIILALRSIARSARLEQMPLEAASHSAEEDALLSEHIVAFHIDGPLFFGAAHRFLFERRDITVLLSGVSTKHNGVLATLGVTTAHHLQDSVFDDTQITSATASFT